MVCFGVVLDSLFSTYNKKESEINTPDEFKPENNLNFSTGKRKHFPFDEFLKSNIIS